MTMTYGQLKQALEDYTENNETSFIANLPLFIRLAEERILKSVQLNLFQKNQAGTMTSGNKYLSAPSDFLAPFSLSITANGDTEFLLFKDLDFLQTYSPDPTATAQPRYYAQFDVENFIIAPTPNANYVVDIHYLYRPASLTTGADSGTTWLSTEAEITLLYACLIEAYTFMKGEANLMTMYNQRYMEGLSRLKNLGEAQETTDAYRTGLISRAKT